MKIDFYVYQHLRSDTGAVFYVGKGRGDRAYEMNARNSQHLSLQKDLRAQGHHVIVEIYQGGLIEDAAYDLEVERIAELRTSGVELVNVARGGRIFGYISEEAIAKRSIRMHARRLRREEIERRQGGACVEGYTRTREEACADRAAERKELARIMREDRDRIAKRRQAEAKDRRGIARELRQQYRDDRSISQILGVNSGQQTEMANAGAQ